MEELSELREFYDPDTVELMTWIRYTHIHLHSIIQSTHQIRLNYPLSSDQVSLCLMSLISLRVHVSILVYQRLYAGECFWWVMRASGSPRIRLEDAGMDPAVGRALTHLWASAPGLSIKIITAAGSEMALWFGVAPFHGCSSCFCVCTSVCVRHFLLIRLDVGHQSSCWHSLCSIPCNYASTMSGQRRITSSIFSVRWLIWMDQFRSLSLLTTKKEMGG